MSGSNKQRVGKGRNGGFTLIEVVVSLAIFAFGILAISRMQLMGLRAAVYKDDYSKATRLAQEMFETVNNFALTDANFDAGEFQLPVAVLGDWQERVAAELGDGAVGTLTPAFNDATLMNNLTVTVEWGGGHQVVFSSQLSGAI